MFATPALAQSAEQLSVRMTQMEDQLRQLIGQVEDLTFQLRQLQEQMKGRKTGELTAPAAQPSSQAAAAQPDQTETQDFAAAGQGVEQIQDSGEQIVTTVVDDAGNEQQVVIRKAPGPQILGTLSNSAAQPNDGGFQGQVIVPPAGGANGEYSAEGGGSVNSDTIETVSLSPETPEALYESSNENLLRRQFGEAEAGFRTFIQRYPDHSLAGSAQFWLGETYYAQGDFRQAAQAFLQGYQNYPKSRRAADSLLKLGISLGRLGQKQQACAAYNAVSSEYPKAVEAKKRAQAEARRAGC
jgi:tol-pal system protein YbgF